LENQPSNSYERLEQRMILKESEKKLSIEIDMELSESDLMSRTDRKKEFI
jgi:hypothetical protein